jgi:F0F1-type ATP synthase epsilon subunit
MKFILVSPQGEELYIIETLRVETGAGALVIKAGHAPLITTLRAHSTIDFTLTSGEQQSIPLARPGFLEINREQVIALINQSPVK